MSYFSNVWARGNFSHVRGLNFLKFATSNSQGDSLMKINAQTSCLSVFFLPPFFKEANCTKKKFDNFRQQQKHSQKSPPKYYDFNPLHRNKNCFDFWLFNAVHMKINFFFLFLVTWIVYLEIKEIHRDLSLITHVTQNKRTFIGPMIANEVNFKATKVT